MAEKQAGGVSLRIGLTLSQLQSDFLAAEQTVRQGIAALNRQQNIVKLKMQTDLSSLDLAADKAKILEVQERSLTQLLEMQRDKLTLATKAYQEYANSKGSNAVVAKNLETSMERERLAVARLESQLKNLSAQKISLDATQLQEKIAKINAKINNVKLKAEIDTSKLSGAAAVFDAQKIHIAAVTRELELQRQKYNQLHEAMQNSIKQTGVGSVQSLNLKSNVLQQIQEINRLEIKLKELQNTNVRLQINADSFRQAETQIRENMSRLNARLESIRVKTEIDTSKLGTAASAFDKAKVHVQGLTRELELQKQKLAELQNAMQQSAKINGTGNVKTINLHTDIQRQIQEINQLKAKIEELNKIQPSKTNSLLGGYLNIKGDVASKLNEITMAFNGLQGASNSVDGAITAVLGVIDTIPRSVGLATAALVGIPLIFKGIENSIVSMTKAATASGDAVYVMSRGFQMSVADSAKFSTNAKVAGVQVNDLAMAVKNVQRQVARGGEDSRAAEWLRKYGESAYDASGNLKDLNEMTFSLSRALKKAQADGKGAEFVLNAFRNVSADAITAIEDWADVSEQASKIVKAGLANPKLAHEVQGNLNAMNVQAGQLNASFSNALLPVANEIVPRMTERMGKMTQVIKENKDVILDLGRDFAQVWSAVEDTFDTVIDKVSALGELARENRVVRQSDTKSVVDAYKDDKTVRSAKDILEKEIAAGGYSDEDARKLRARNDLYLKEVQRTEQDAKAIWEKRRKEFAEANKPILDKYKFDDSIKTGTDLLKKLTDEEKTAIMAVDSAFGSMQERAAVLNMELQETRKQAKQASAEVKAFKSVAEDFSTAGQERRLLDDDKLDLLRQAKKYEENAQAIRDKLSLTDYEYQKNSLWRWLKEQLPADVEQSMEKYQAVMKEFAARDAQIEQDRADKLKKIRESVAAAEKTALENKLDNIEKERQAWIKAGMDEAEATKLAQKKIAKAYEEAAEKVQEHLRNAADIEYELTHTAFEKQIRDIEQWEEAQKKKAETAEEIAGIVAESAAKETEAFEREVDRIRGKIQSLEDKIFEQEHSQFANDVRKLQQERLELYREGIYSPALIERYYQNAMSKLNQRAAESQAKGSDYTKSPDGGMQRGGNGIMVIGGDQIIDDGLIQSQQQEIGLLTDENKIRAQLLPQLSDDAREMTARIQAAKELSAAQRDLIQQTQQAASSFQLIEGDKVSNQSQVISGDQIQMPTQELNQFGEAVQQKASEIKQFDSLSNLATSTQQATDAQNAFATAVQNFPPDYFKNLADGTKSVSDSQSWLTKSTLELIDAQTALSNALKNLPTEQTENTASNDGYLKLSTSTQEVTDAQNLLARTSRETATSLEQITDIPPQKEIAQKDSGMKFGFDMDAAGLVAGMGSLALAGVAAPVSAPILGGVVLTSLLAGLAKGTYDETTAASQQANETLKPLAEVDLSGVITTLEKTDSDVQSVLQELQKISESEIDFSSLTTPLNSIDTTAQEILQTMATEKPEESDRLQELFGTLPNIEAGVGDILSALQSKEETADTELDLSQLVTPLTSINENIQAAIQQMQENKPYENDSLQELFGTLPNIGEDVKSILLAMQEEKAAPVSEAQPPIDYLTPLNTINTNVQSVLTELQAKEPLSFDTLVTPLNTIQTAVGNILTALGNRQPPQITISPNNNVNLGGAYVFDNEMKQSLVNDITREIVDNITSAVRQATSQSSYGYGA